MINSCIYILFKMELCFCIKVDFSFFVALSIYNALSTFKVYIVYIKIY